MRTLIIIALLWGGGLLFAQDTTDVPESVKMVFEQMYPDAGDVKWEKEDEGYEAEFKEDGMEVNVKFDKEGSVIETEKEIKQSMLPDAVMSAIVSEYRDYKIKEAATLDRNGEILYEVELQKEDEEIEAVFSVDGTLVEKKAEHDEDDDEDDDEK